MNWDEFERWSKMILYEELNEENSFDLAMNLVLRHNQKLYLGLAQPKITEETTHDIQAIKEIVPRLAKRLFSIKQQVWSEYTGGVKYGK